MNNSSRESENWFFKVWSNKFLRSKILLKVKIFNDFYNNYKYDRIISCYWMIENGYFQLLKEKVEKGEYLVFNSSLIYHSKFDNKYLLSQRERVNKNLENGDDEFVLNENSIFYKEKALIHWDLKFYNNLFKNYSNYFLNFNKSITESTLIQYDNQQALQVLVENFNHVLEIESFFKSFEIGSYECSFYIFNNLKNEILKSKNYQSRIWNILINNIKLSKKDINKVENLINNSVDFIINKCNIQLPPPPQQQQFTPWLFNFQIYEQKLSLIYNCVRSIVQLKEFFKSYIKSINNNSFKFKYENKDIIETNNLVKKYIKKFVKLLVYDENGKKKKDFKIPDLKEIESMKFTNQQFNSTISDLITDGDDDENCENKDIQVNLGILYFSLIPFIEQYDHLIGNLIFYKVKILNEKDFIKYNYLYPKLSPKMFGIYGVYGYKFNNENNLFIYCKNNRNLQIEYIGKIFESFQNQKYPLDNLLFLFRNLVWLNDLECVNLLINKMKDNGYRFEDNDRQSLILMIKSIEMFDLIYRNFKSQSKNQNNNNNNNNNIYNTSYPISENKFFFSTLLKSKFENLSILLQHYKDNYTNDYYSIVDSIDFKNKNFPFEVFKFVYDNLIDFKDYEKVSVWSGTNDLKSIKTLNQFKYLVKLTPINKEYKIPYGNESFFKFIIEERLNDLEIGRCDTTGTSLPDYRYFKIYRNYRVNKIENENENENKKQLYYSFEGNNTILRNTLIKACKYNDFQFIDMVMEESFLYDQNNKDNENFKNIYIISILEVICSQGDLELFKYLYSKYSNTIDFYLTKNDKPGFNGYCLPIKLALLNGNIDFLLFILNLISDKIYITSNTTINNKLLLNHFLNEKNELLTILL
ncbi:hypothetical protein ACTFIW_008195 [Dictyostelium discoideum]